MGGGGFQAPATKLTDFLTGTVSTLLNKTSYRRGLVSADLRELYQPAIISALKRAIFTFDKKIPGFITEEAMLLGVETKTASPIRVLRGPDYQAVGPRGVYPAGEGMGYGGGIVSAAIDGIKVAEALLLACGAERELQKIEA